MRDDEIHDFIEARKHLVWYVKDHRALSEESIVEAVLNYGNWNDVQEMIRILGIKHTAEVFYKDSRCGRRRGNYYPETLCYFERYFARHAPKITPPPIKPLPWSIKTLVSDLVQ